MNLPLLITRILKPIFCIFVVFGILLLVTSFKNIFIKNSLVKKIALYIGSLGIGTFLLFAVIFVSYVAFVDDILYRSAQLFLLRSPKIISVCYYAFKFIGESFTLNSVFAALLFFGINGESTKIDIIPDNFRKCNKKASIGFVFIFFAVLSFLTTELIAPAMHRYVSATYNNSSNYLIHFIVIPIAIFALAFGIF